MEKCFMILVVTIASRMGVWVQMTLLKDVSINFLQVLMKCLLNYKGTNISFSQGTFESMIFLFPRWDMLVLWRVIFWQSSVSFSDEFAPISSRSKHARRMRGKLFMSELFRMDMLRKLPSSTCKTWWFFEVILLMVQKSQTTTWNVQNLVNHGINYRSLNWFSRRSSGCHQQLL